MSMPTTTKLQLPQLQLPAAASTTARVTAAASATSPTTEFTAAPFDIPGSISPRPTQRSSRSAFVGEPSGSPVAPLNLFSAASGNEPLSAASASGSGASGHATPSRDGHPTRATGRGRSPSQPLISLVEHQEFRQRTQSPVRCDDESESSSTSSDDGGAGEGVAAGTAHRSRPGGVDSRRSSGPSSLHLSQSGLAPYQMRRVEERLAVASIHNSGRKLWPRTSTPSLLPSSSGAGAVDAATLRPHPMRCIHTIAVCDRGVHVAVGDKMGNVWIAKRESHARETTLPPHHNDKAVEDDDDDVVSCFDERRRSRRHRRRSSSLSSSPATLPSDLAAAGGAGGGPTSPSVEYFVGKRCYAPVMDPLNSVEVTPAVQTIAFLPQNGPTLHMLVSNEKLPKLYRCMPQRTTPPAAPRAATMIGTRHIGPLTQPNGGHHVNFVQTAHYAMDHEYQIHSCCVPQLDPHQFLTSDEACVRLWCVEYPQISVEVFHMMKGRSNSSSSSGTPELIRRAVIFPHEPSLVFLCTTQGFVRAADVRESMRWAERDILSFHAPSRSAQDGPFSEVTQALSSTALSPCGRYLAARDFMSVPIWDIRKGTSNATTAQQQQRGGPSDGLLCRVEVHPHLGHHLEALYQSQLMTERYDVTFSNGSANPSLSTSASSLRLLTGSVNETLCLVDVHDASSVGSASGDAKRAVLKRYRLRLQGSLSDPVYSSSNINDTTNTGVLMELMDDAAMEQRLPWDSAEAQHHTGRVTSVVPFGRDGGEWMVGCGESLVQLHATS